jgi:hypothetical protein
MPPTGHIFVLVTSVYAMLAILYPFKTKNNGPPFIFDSLKSVQAIISQSLCFVEAGHFFEQVRISSCDHVFSGAFTKIGQDTWRSRGFVWQN